MISVVFVKISPVGCNYEASILSSNTVLQILGGRMKIILNEKRQEVIPDILPVIPTMDVVIFPHVIIPLLVLDEKIVKGIDQSLKSSKMVLLLAAKKNIDIQKIIGTDDLYKVGTIALIMRIIKLPEGGIKILVQGIHKARALTIATQDGMLQANIEKIDLEKNDPQELMAIIANIKILAEKMANIGHPFSPDFHTILTKMRDPEKIADFVLSHLNLAVEQSQHLLEVKSQKEFLEKIYYYLSKEEEVAVIQEKIRNNARESMNQSQKEFYLREQLKAIKQELGENDVEEIDSMHQKLAKLTVSEETKKEIRRQINRLEKTTPDSLEATVTRNYLDLIFSLPWGIITQDNLDIKHAKTILNRDHFGLDEVKNRILDFISIRNLKKDGQAPILCFVGPPGTGKTSLGKSIAESLGRKYARISLGGVRDEAEIRGHRRTYVGAMPGRFVQAVKKAGSCNPLIVIDELDKIGSDFRGDPSAAMLEVLDPQQNKSFYDNYLGVPFDLSQVMFVATANTVESMSDPLRDRIEIIELSGYTLEEKINIGKKFLTKKIIADSGLDQIDFTIPESVLKKIISDYTRESGVRQFERLIRTVCSKVARALVEKKEVITLTADNIPLYLGPQKFFEEESVQENKIGISTGIAWTPYGGEIIKIEAVLMPGKGKLLLTGQLGNVMKESAETAKSYVRSHARDFGIDDALFRTHDIHIHIPAGSIPKDGPSAGITMLIAIFSILTKKPINAQYAMTGEINLRGEIMPIGGVKEKILAVKRNQITHVILPKKNEHNLAGLKDIIKGIDIMLVGHANEVLEKVLNLKPIEKQ